MVNATALATIWLLKKIFCYRIPKSIHSDCGTQVKSKVVCKALGINLTDTKSYNPKGNGQVEHIHRDHNSMFLAMVMDDPESWKKDSLPEALFAL